MENFKINIVAKRPISAQESQSWTDSSRSHPASEQDSRGRLPWRAGSSSERSR